MISPAGKKFPVQLPADQPVIKISINTISYVILRAWYRGIMTAILSHPRNAVAGA